MVLQTHNICSRENSAQPHLIFTNEDLLTEILIRLPILCIHLFTSVSKQWLRILTSPDFTLRRSKIPNLDPPAGIFANHIGSLFECDFVSFDSRLKSRKPTMDLLFSIGDKVDHVRIAQSCNGLILCTGSSLRILYSYVCNPSINLFKRLPQPYHLHNGLGFYTGGVLRIAFDPRKSRYYKVVQACRTSAVTRLQIYSSETGNWSLCRDQFNKISFHHFDSAIYWNDAFHLLEGVNRHFQHCKLNIEDRDNPIMTTLEIPHVFLEGKFFESYGCLLHVCRDDTDSTELKIYEMIEGSSVWSFRYHVNIEELMNPLPEGWSIRTSGWSIYLGEEKEHAFLVIHLSRKVLKYNLITKNFNEIFDIESKQINDNDNVEFIPPFSVDPELYEFIPSLASV